MIVGFSVLLTELGAQFYNGLAVTPSGEVGVCWARDTNLDLKVGNINDNSLQEIWQSKEIKKLRQGWIDVVMPYPCNDCFQYCSVLDHSLIQKYILRNAWQYPAFLLFVIKSKIADVAERAKSIFAKFRAH